MVERVLGAWTGLILTAALMEDFLGSCISGTPRTFNFFDCCKRKSGLELNHVVMWSACRSMDTLVF